MSKRVNKAARKIVHEATEQLYERFVTAVADKLLTRREVYTLLGVSKQRLSKMEEHRFSDITMLNYYRLDVILTLLGARNK